MGNKFTAHPWAPACTVAIKIDEPDHPLTAPFKGQGFKVKDEIYRTAPPLYSRDKQFVLMSLDMSDPATRDMKGVIESRQGHRHHLGQGLWARAGCSIARSATTTRSS